jgi:mannose-6-phosphate isomerase-like protein (cupin superfamily)
MPQIIDDVRSFTAARPWGALDLAAIAGATVRLHWTDQPYRWHVNDGPEVFVVLDGQVDMHFRDEGGEKRVALRAGDIFVVDEGEAHVAHPVGEARILVIETAGSV